jgi:hypothetical protein
MEPEISHPTENRINTSHILTVTNHFHFTYSAQVLHRQIFTAFYGNRGEGIFKV